MTAIDRMRHAMARSAEARADLAEGLEEGEPESGVEEAWAVEVQRRLADVDSGAVKPIPWSVARARIEAAAGRGQAH